MATLGRTRLKNRSPLVAIITAGVLLALAVVAGREPARGALLGVVAPIVKTGYAVREGFAAFFAAFSSTPAYAEENQNLRRGLAEALVSRATQETLATQAALALHRPAYLPPERLTLIPAPVLANAPAQGRQIIWLGKGRVHGVEKGMIVLGEAGILGLVEEVQDGTSLALLLTDRRGTLGGETGDTFATGLVRGTGDPSLVEFQFDRTDATCAVGAVIVTSALAGSVAPGGLLIGIVESLQPNKKGEPSARVRLAAPAQNLRSVFVLTTRPITLAGVRP